MSDHSGACPTPEPQDNPGCLGVWATDKLPGQLGYQDGRGMDISITTQRIAAAKTLVRDELGLHLVAKTLQAPFDYLEGRANKNPGGIVDRSGPFVLNALGLLSEGLVRAAGRRGLIEQMYPQTPEGAPNIGERAIG